MIKKSVEVGKNYDKIFSERLKEIRTGARLSRAEVAARLGIAVSTYGNWEQGRRAPSIGDIYKLIEVLEIDANELFEI